LWQQYPDEHNGEVENLIIELKRPSCILRQKEITQIEEYCFKVSTHDLFPKEKTRWTFILLGTDYDDFVKFKLKHPTDKSLLLDDPDGKVRIFVKKWNEVILDAKLKLDFLKNKLDYQINDNDEGMEYLTEKYKQYFTDKKTN
jgi:hypothetical protein